MREIKFRAWDGNHQKMLEGVGWLNGVWYLPSGLKLTTTNNIMQYTGLKDTSRKDIYEGDVIQDEEGDTFKVYWNEQQAQFLCDLIGAEGIGIYDEFSIQDTGGLVIGNIYQNPNLLTP